MTFDHISSLCKHRFIEELKDKFPSEQKKCFDLIAYGQDILYIWNGKDGYIHSINVKHSIRDSDFGNQVILQPLQGILFAPDRILLNPSSSLLALLASEEDGSGISVIELPEKWTVEKEKIKVPCRNLGERLFIGEQLILRQAKWHPASPSDSHLLVLTSDECLRLYNATTGATLWKCSLTRTNRMLHASFPSKISIGDTPVDFDIGPPSQEDSLSKLKWPVLILWGNGDVYCIDSFIDDIRDKIPSHGPLRMFPSSDDNYGSDACSILILHTSPPIVAFSTSIGTIYNCIFLSSEEQNGYDKSLHVVECIELELGITLGEEDDIISSPIRLVPNPIEKSMFFAIHRAGIHSVMLPLVAKLLEFLESSETFFSPYIYKSFVEYLLCTGYNKNSSLDALPILGSTFIDLSSSLLVLLNNKEIINIKVTPHILNAVYTLDANINQKKDEDGLLLYIQRLLKEHGPGPLIRLPNSEPEDIFNMLCKIKLSYRTTMEAHEKVAKKLKEKSNALLAEFKEQEKQVEDVKEEQNELYLKELEIAERYRELSQKQMSLMCRVENILRNACSESMLSEKERNALNYLENVRRKISIFEREIQRIEDASHHQGKMIGERIDIMVRRAIDLSDTRGRTMRKQLQNITTEIALLMKRIKAIEETVPELMFRSTYPTIQYN